jgi:hypothetical protein
MPTSTAQDQHTSTCPKHLATSETTAVTETGSRFTKTASAAPSLAVSKIPNGVVGKPAKSNLHFPETHPTDNISFDGSTWVSMELIREEISLSSSSTVVGLKSVVEEMDHQVHLSRFPAMMYTRSTILVWRIISMLLIHCHTINRKYISIFHRHELIVVVVLLFGMVLEELTL